MAENTTDGLRGGLLLTDGTRGRKWDGQSSLGNEAGKLPQMLLVM